jgi:hypothetical protein
MTGLKMKLNDLFPNEAQEKSANESDMVMGPARVKPPVAAPRDRVLAQAAALVCTIKAATCLSSAASPSGAARVSPLHTR